MKKTCLQLLLFGWFYIVSIPILIAQKNKAIIDSLEKLAAIQKDSSFVQTLNELTWQYRMVNRDKAIEYGNKAIEAGKKIKFDKGIAQAYNCLLYTSDAADE